MFVAVIEELLAKGMQNAENVCDINCLPPFIFLLNVFPPLTETCYNRLFSLDVQLEDWLLYYNVITLNHFYLQKLK